MQSMFEKNLKNLLLRVLLVAGAVSICEAFETPRKTLPADALSGLPDHESGRLKEIVSDTKIF